MRRRIVVALGTLLFSIGAACSSFSSEDDPAVTPPVPEAGAEDVYVPVDAAIVDGCVDVCPEVFAGSQGTIVAMAADEDTLFWMVSGATVMRRSFATLDAIKAVAGTEMAADIAVRKGFLYWTDLTTLSRADIDSGAITVIDRNFQTSVVVDDTDVYWSNGNDMSVHRLATAHLEVDSSTPIHQSDPNALALDDTTTGGGSVFFRTTAFSLESVAVHGNSMRATISATGHVASHDSDDGGVFWTEDIDGGTNVGLVRRAATDGTAAADLARLQSHPSLIVASSDHVYWVVVNADGTSSIMRRPR